MDDILKSHQKDYSTTDLKRQNDLYYTGLWGYEEYYIDKHFNPKLTTLELGTGGGRVVVALENHKHFHNITAVDFVEKLISINAAKGVAFKSKIKYGVANAIDLPFRDESFDQVICSGELISHFPNRNYRIKVFEEAYRVLKSNGVLFANSLNIQQGRYVYIMRLITKIIRTFYNPRHYWPNDLPRLGARSGKLDWLCFRYNKSQLHYYYPAEMAYDLLSVGFAITEMNLSKQGREIKDPDFHFFRKQDISIICKKIT